jgi:hypothetical protein
MKFSQKPNPDKIINMILKEFEKFPNIVLSPKMIEDIKTYILFDSSKDLYYEAGRLFYNRWPLFLIRWIIREKHRKIFAPSSLTREAVNLVADLQVKQAKKLLFKSKQNNFY